MVVTDLADAGGSVAFQLGTLVGMAILPGAGLIMLIIGLRQRSRSQQPGPYPPGYPPNTGYPYQPGYPQPPHQGYPPGYPPPRQPGKSGTALIVIGAVLLALGLLGILGQLANVGSSSGRSGDTPQGSSPSSVGFVYDRPTNESATPCLVFDLKQRQCSMTARW